MNKKLLSILISCSLCCCSFLEAQNSMLKFGFGVFSPDSESTVLVGEGGLEYHFKNHLALNITATTSSATYDGYRRVKQTMITPQLRYYINSNWRRSFYGGLAVQYHKHNSYSDDYTTMQTIKVYSKRKGAALIGGYQIGSKRIGLDFLIGLKKEFGYVYTDQLKVDGTIISQSVKENQIFSKVICGINMYIVLGNTNGTE